MRVRDNGRKVKQAGRKEKNLERERLAPDASRDPATTNHSADDSARNGHCRDRNSVTAIPDQDRMCLDERIFVLSTLQIYLVAFV